MALLKVDSEYDYVADYYNFIFKKLEQIELTDDYALVGSHNYETEGHKIIFVNYEHNIVHPSFFFQPRLIGDTPLIDDNSQKYLVRVERINQLINSEIYIEYSNPNIYNLKSCSDLTPFFDKIIYVPPLLCDYNPVSSSEKKFDVITSFLILNPEGRPRRQILYDELNIEFGKKYINIPKVFGEELYENYYHNSKILLNVHQTDHHHTFEELRVLPALLNGLIVIAEDSPLKETIPYHEYIIWCKYEEIIEKTKEVLHNYESFWNKIHGDFSNLKNIINTMETQLIKDLKTKFNSNLKSLTEIFNQEGSDKGTYFTHKGQTQNIAHYYTLIYEQHLEKFRNEEFNYLEIGIWSPYYPGASVRAWTRYFKNANFYGIDIEKDCKVLQQEKINIDIVDQTSESQLQDYIADKDKFKFIIDDGIHVEEAITISLGTLFPKLENGGLYFIEDLHVVDKTRLYGLVWRQFKTHIISDDKVKYINDNIDWCSFSPDGKLCIIKKK